MKICWDNLEEIVYRPDRGTWLKNKTSYIYVESCKECKEPYLAYEGHLKRGMGLFCCRSCAQSGKNAPMYGKTGKNNPNYGRKHTEETKRKMSKMRKGRKHPFYGKKHSKETIKKISKANRGKNNYGWKGGISNTNKSAYSTYVHQINWCEEVRRDPEDENILQVKCSYNECKKWTAPTNNMVRNRINALEGRISGEHKFYCSDECKRRCSIYKKSPKTLMREDAIKAGRDPWWYLPREVQSELRQMVHERDGWTCIKCDSTENLHCHHIDGILYEPLLSADVDECITVCKNCHREIHLQKDCTYNDMKCLQINVNLI